MVPLGALGFLYRTRSHGLVVCWLFRPGRERVGGLGLVWYRGKQVAARADRGRRGRAAEGYDTA
jgi:hypothetical protein